MSIKKSKQKGAAYIYGNPLNSAYLRWVLLKQAVKFGYRIHGILKENIMTDVTTGLELNKQLLQGFEAVALAIAAQARAAQSTDASQAQKQADLEAQIAALQTRVDAGQELDAQAIQAAKDAAIGAVTGFASDVAPKLVWLADELKKSDSSLAGLIVSLNSIQVALSDEIAAVRKLAIDAGTAAAVADTKAVTAQATADEALGIARGVDAAVAVMGVNLGTSVVQILNNVGLTTEGK